MKFVSFFQKEQSSLSILALLRRLSKDPAIQGLVIRIRGFNLGDGRIQEWRDALMAMREARKQVVVYLDNPSERDYYVATAAHKIFMNNQSALSLTRFQKTLVYFADLLAKIGIKANHLLLEI